MLKKLMVGLLMLTVFAVFGGEVRAAASNYIQPYELTTATGTTFNLIDTGRGILYDVASTSGTVGSFTVCFDTASVTGLTANGDGTSVAPRIANVIITATDTVNHLFGGNPLTAGFQYDNGLACGNSATARSVIYYKPQD